MKKKIKRILNKNNYYIILLIFFIVLVLISINIFKVNIKKTNNGTNEENNFQPYKKLQMTSKEELEDIFINRYINIDYNKNSITIGKNKKEVENEYYDIKTYFIENRLKIYINKLTKDEVECNKVDEIYIKELCNYIYNLLNINNNEIKKEYNLDTIIINEYNNLRNTKESKQNKDNINNIDINNYNISFSIYNNNLVLVISMRGDI